MHVLAHPDHSGVAYEDRDLHSDLLRCEKQIEHLAGVIVRQAEMLCLLLDRREKDRRARAAGMAGVEGLDRRDSERRGKRAQQRGETSNGLSARPAGGAAGKKGDDRPDVRGVPEDGGQLGR